MSEQWELNCLSYDPFGDWKDDGGYRHLRDVMVTTRKDHVCCECEGVVATRTRCRAITSVTPEETVVTIYWCERCSRQMAETMAGAALRLENQPCHVAICHGEEEQDVVT